MAWKSDASVRLGGVVVVLAAVVVGGALVWRSHVDAREDRRDAAQRFAMAWARADRPAMWRALTARARAAHPEAAFAAAYRSTDRAAGVRAVRIVRFGAEQNGKVALVVAVNTRDFSALRGTVSLPVAGAGADAGVQWDHSLRLPGLRPGEGVSSRSDSQPQRALVLAADGTPLDATALGASIAGQAGAQASGLQRIYDRRLGGRPARRLLFGARVVAHVPAVAPRSVQTTIKPRLMAQAAGVLGARVGGVAVIRPRDGAVLALAGLAVSAPQPPGSVFKIITVAGALQHGVATRASTYPGPQVRNTVGRQALQRLSGGLRRHAN
jgi:penicillin-binding protein A